MSSPTDEQAGGDLKAALERFAGHEIDANPDQLQQQIILTPIPFSNYSFTPAPTEPFQTNVGEVVSRRVIIVLPNVCGGSELLDVSGVASTSSAGNAILLVKNFLCPGESGRFYLEPVITVATPASATPSFLTITHSLVFDPSLNSATNVQINVFSWGINGAPAPNVPFNFRCRVPTSPIIL
jgi:hypothetical protein